MAPGEWTFMPFSCLNPIPRTLFHVQGGISNALCELGETAAASWMHSAPRAVRRGYMTVVT